MRGYCLTTKSISASLQNSLSILIIWQDWKKLSNNFFISTLNLSAVRKIDPIVRKYMHVYHLANFEGKGCEEE
jgi:hypothetical protein